MIKKITLLLAVLLCTMAATAATTTYKGTMKTSNGTTEMTEENSVVELDRTLLIHYKATVKDFKIMISPYHLYSLITPSEAPERTLPSLN